MGNASLITLAVEDWLLTTTFRDLPDRKDFINEKTLPLIPEVV